MHFIGSPNLEGRRVADIASRQSAADEPRTQALRDAGGRQPRVREGRHRRRHRLGQ